MFIFGGANALVDPSTGRLPPGGQHFNDLHAFHTGRLSFSLYTFSRNRCLGRRVWVDLTTTLDPRSGPPAGVSYSVAFAPAPSSRPGSDSVALAPPSAVPFTPRPLPLVLMSPCALCRPPSLSTARGQHPCAGRGPVHVLSPSRGVHAGWWPFHPLL